MNTPIYDYVTEYCQKSPSRFHMPGHKGVNSLLGMENRDITEIDGAGDLWSEEADNIVAMSEANASAIFGCRTFYSTEGSSLAIRGMLFMIKKWAYIKNVSPIILAGRNAHKTFVNTAAILDIPVYFVHKSSDESSIGCNLTEKDVDNALNKMGSNKPVAVYITTPDYLGNLLNIEGIAKVCHNHGVFLLVDNAHGAYLKFAEDYMHPIEAGADICCDSAHKTLPALTGSAYLHVSCHTDSFFAENAKSAMGMFGSTSPSYLILQSLDLCNKYLSDDFALDLKRVIDKTAKAKEKLLSLGYELAGNEPIKITIAPKGYGYTGIEIADIVMMNNIYPEHYDEDYIVFMVSVKNGESDFERLCDVLSSIGKKSNTEKKSKIEKKSNEVKSHDIIISDASKNAMKPMDAMLSESYIVSSDDAVGKILAQPAISCPPCVPVYMAGERITDIITECENVRVVKEDKQKD